MTAIPEEAPTALLRRFEPLGAYLGERLGRSVEFVPVVDHAAGALLVWLAFRAIGLDPLDLVDGCSLAAAGRFLAGFVPPAHDPAFLLRAGWTTVAIATVGLLAALLVGVPLALLGTARLSVSALGRSMSGNGVAVRLGARGVALVLRGVPELVWALLLVRVTGLGHGAGVLAVAFTGAGLIAKVYAEILESAPCAPVEALLANGAGRARALLYGAPPQCADALAVAETSRVWTRSDAPVRWLR